jgi:hypothetical protein
MAQFERGNVARDYIPTTSSARFAPRFDHDPLTNVSRGLLIEDSRTNLCRYSGRLVIGVGWGASGTTSVEDGIGPDGDVAYQITETSGGAVIHTILNTGGTGSLQVASITSGVVYTGSIFLKKVTGSVDWVQVTFASAGFGVSQYVNINLSNGTIGNSSGGTAKVESYANGWYRVSWTCTATTTTTTSGTILVAGIQNTNGTTRAPSYVGTTDNKFLAAAAQFEVNSFATSYIPTTTTSVVRGVDVCTISGSDFSQFYNGNEGTIVSEAAATGLSTADNAIYSFTSGLSNIIRVYNRAAQLQRLSAGVSGSGILTPPSNYNTSGVFYRAALSCNVGGIDYVIDGSQIPDTSTTSSVSSADTLTFSNISFSRSNNIIKSFRYYRRGLPVPKLQALTS